MKKIRKLTPEKVEVGSEYKITCLGNPYSCYAVNILAVTDCRGFFIAALRDNTSSFKASFCRWRIFNTREELLAFKMHEARCQYGDIIDSGYRFIFYTRLAKYYRDYVLTLEDARVTTTP